MHWRLGPATTLDLSRPRVLAILNVTPDSFSDGGSLPDAAAAADAALAAMADGADALDVGGESTRPGATRVAARDQIARVVPAIRAIRDAGIEHSITIDTTRAAVAEAALDAGADAINDVSGGTEDAAMLPMLAERGAGVILMHRLTTPDRDRYSDRYEAPPGYTDVVADVTRALADLARRAIDVGVAAGAIVVDPGLGFGKSVEQNLALIRGTRTIAALGFPVLAAASRKSFTARAAMAAEEADPAPPGDRLAGSIACSLAQLSGGARLFRVHDVREQARALRAAWRIAGSEARE